MATDQLRQASRALRWVVERGFAWLHRFKRLRIRYEVRADLHLGLLHLVCYRKLPPPA